MLADNDRKEDGLRMKRRSEHGEIESVRTADGADGPSHRSASGTRRTTLAEPAAQDDGDGRPTAGDPTQRTLKPGTRGPIHPGMTVRLVASDFPGAADVFRRHGEQDRTSSKFGHLEPLDRFAHRRNIPLAALLDELAQATGVPAIPDDPSAWQPHRPFIATSLAITLTLGAGWGAWLLTEIGYRGSLAGVSANAVVAHGEAQLWGFVATFIMGIAAGFLPKTTAGPQPSRGLLRFLLAALLATVLGGFVWSLDAARLPWLGFVSGLGASLAAVGYLALTGSQVATKWRVPWARFVLASAAWMSVWAVATLVFRTHAGAAGPGAYSDSVRGALLDLALFGFAVNAVYGFGLRLLPGMLGRGAPKRGAIEAIFVLHNMGVLALAISHTAWTGLFQAVGAVAILGGALPWVAGLHSLQAKQKSTPRPELGPPLLARYIQLALFWFVGGLAMLAAGGIFSAFDGNPMSRAYLGATRHALTVGFLTTLILGVAQRLLPILSHDLLAWPRLVAPILALIATGNALRVATQLSTLASPIAFWIMPLSSLLELTALALFAANAFRVLWPAPDVLLRTGRVTEMTRAAILLAEHPWIEDRLIASGVGYFGRVRSVPTELTLSSLAAGKSMTVDTLVTDINRMLEDHERENA